MASETPPTDYFTGISFNPDFYQSTSSDYLTPSTGKNYFLSYPTAQGTETISKIFSSNVDSLTPTAEFDFLASQTSGQINIGAGLSTGNMEIANGANFGGNVLIANSASAGNTNTIELGNSFTSSNLNGTVSITNGLNTLGGIINTGTLTSTSNISTSGVGTITAVGGLIGGYQNASSSPSASITTAGAITGASLALGTGAISTVGAITSTGTISTSGKITCSQVDSLTATTEMSVGSNLASVNLTLGSGLTSGGIIIGKNNGAHTGEIRIGATQTSGVMNIATGSTRSGALNICNTSGATNTINLGVNGTPVNIEGSLIKIGATQTSAIMEIATSSTRTGNVFFCSTTGQTNNIYIGASGTKSIMDGTVSILQPLTLPVATTTPTTTQLGFFVSSNNGTEITVSATNSTPATVTNLPIGIYLFSYSVISYTPSIGASQVMTYSITTTGGATSSIANYVFNGVATTFQDTQRLVGVVKATTASNSVVLNLIITSGGGTIKASQYGYNYIKIA